MTDLATLYGYFRSISKPMPVISTVCVMRVTKSENCPTYPENPSVVSSFGDNEAGDCGGNGGNYTKWEKLDTRKRRT